MSTKPIEALVRTYFTKVAAMNPDGWLDDFAEDAVSYDPVGQPLLFPIFCQFKP